MILSVLLIGSVFFYLLSKKNKKINNVAKIMLFLVGFVFLFTIVYIFFSGLEVIPPNDSFLGLRVYDYGFEAVKIYLSNLTLKSVNRKINSYYSFFLVLWFIILLVLLFVIRKLNIKQIMKYFKNKKNCFSSGAKKKFEISEILSKILFVSFVITFIIMLFLGIDEICDFIYILYFILLLTIIILIINLYENNWKKLSKFVAVLIITMWMICGIYIFFPLLKTVFSNKLQLIVDNNNLIPMNTVDLYYSPSFDSRVIYYDGCGGTEIKHWYKFIDSDENNWYFVNYKGIFGWINIDGLGKGWFAKEFNDKSNKISDKDYETYRYIFRCEENDMCLYDSMHKLEEVLYKGESYKILYTWQEFANDSGYWMLIEHNNDRYWINNCEKDCH